jgi:glycosyltransferase involved in cell wall biosynthesis
VSLRVCFIVDSGTDVRLVEGLAERVELTILARRIRGGREISQTPRRALEVEVGPATHLAFAWFVVRRWFALRRRTDAVIVQGYGPAAAVANALGRLNGHAVRMLVCSPVEAYYRSRRAPDSRRRYRPLEYRAIAALARFNAWLGQGYIALSPYLASVIRDSGTHRAIEVIPVYGVDGRIFRPSDEPMSAIRARLGLPQEDRIVFFSSRVAPEKDASTVLRAIGLLTAAGRPVRLLHLSGGHKEFVALAEALGVADRVVAGDAVVPFAPLADYYRASDVCVQASREEGLGFSPLEALACGVPVVASAVGGLTDTIRDGDTGWSVTVGDATALADAIAAILDNPAEAARRTANGRAMVQSQYERDVVFGALADSLARAVQPRS